MIRVLFLCVHNSARSQMAESYLRKYAGNVEAESAGLEPGKLNTWVVRVLREDGIDIAGKPTRSVFDVLAAGKRFDYVITVCSQEAAERCPAFPGRAEKRHWPFEDPSTFSGGDARVLEQVRALRNQIRDKVREFAAEIADRT